MARVEVLMPKMGESVAEATVIGWLKEVGDTVELEEAVVEIATDKVDSEIPAPSEGVLVEKLVDADDVVKVGQAVAIIETDGEGEESAPAPAAETAAPAPVAEAAATIEQEVTAAVTELSKDDYGKAKDGDRFYSPLVRSIAATEGIAKEELDNVAGTGQGGRVTKSDILAYVAQRGSTPAPVAPAPVAPAPAAPAPAAPAPAATPAAPAPAQVAPVSISGEDEIIEMDRMRKMIADHMVMSKQVSPHVTSFVEADVTNIVNWRNRVKNEFQKREGDKITFTPLFIHAIVKAIKDYPMINVSVDGTTIVKKRNINIGMAVALPSGNLIVPVIKNADQLSLVGLSKAVNDLARKARENKLTPDDISGATYTITNVGSFGNVMGTPIINQPQVAIMAVGAIVKKPAVIETPQGDLIGIRQKMFLSHSYDHRVVDGALGGMFVKRVAEYLEAWDANADF